MAESGQSGTFTHQDALEMAREMTSKRDHCLALMRLMPEVDGKIEISLAMKNAWEAGEAERNSISRAGIPVKVRWATARSAAAHYQSFIHGAQRRGYKI